MPRDVSCGQVVEIKCIGKRENIVRNIIRSTIELRHNELFENDSWAALFKVAFSSLSDCRLLLLECVDEANDSRHEFFGIVFIEDQRSINMDYPQ